MHRHIHFEFSGAALLFDERLNTTIAVKFNHRTTQSEVEKGALTPSWQCLGNARLTSLSDVLQEDVEGSQLSSFVTGDDLRQSRDAVTELPVRHKWVCCQLVWAYHDPLGTCVAWGSTMIQSRMRSWH